MQFHRAKSTPDIPLELMDNKSEPKPLQFKPRQESIVNASSKSKKSKKKHDKRYKKVKRTRSCTNLNSKKRASKRDNSLNPKRYNSIPTQSDKSTSSEPCYVIQAHYKNNILAITVYDSSSSNKWRQEFTKDSFQHHKIYKVAKILINSIKKTGKNDDDNDYGKKKQKTKDEYKDIKIFEYNGFCYVTLIDSSLPSFALRPISNMIELKEEIEPIQESDDGSVSPPIDPVEIMMQSPPSLHAVTVQNMIQNTSKSKLPIIINDNDRKRHSTGNIINNSNQNEPRRMAIIDNNHKYYHHHHQQPLSYPIINDNNNTNNNNNKFRIKLNGNHLLSTQQSHLKGNTNYNNYNNINNMHNYHYSTMNYMNNNITKWSLPGNFGGYHHANNNNNHNNNNNNNDNNNNLYKDNHEFNGHRYRKESNDTLYSNTSWISSSPSTHSNAGYNSGITSISVDSNSTLSPSAVLSPSSLTNINKNKSKKQGPGFDHDQNDKNQVIIITHKQHHHKKSLSDTFIDGDYYKDRSMADKENVKYDYV